MSFRCSIARVHSTYIDWHYWNGHFYRVERERKRMRAGEYRSLWNGNGSESKTNWLTDSVTNQQNNRQIHTHNRKSFAETNTIFYFISLIAAREWESDVTICCVCKCDAIESNDITSTIINFPDWKSEIEILLTVDRRRKSVHFANTIWWKVGASVNDIGS